jgi:ribosomal protein S6--L-glutamate ligase
MLGKGSHSLLHIGWQEWCAIEDLDIPAIKAKIDTGAKTSAIHATEITPFTRKDQLYVHFVVFPLQRNSEIQVKCTAPVVDKRVVMSSNGIQEDRYVIRTQIKMGDQTWEIDLTLSDRDPLRFRLLLGREALKNRVIINPAKHCCIDKLSAREINDYYYKDIPHKSRHKHADIL